MEEKKEIDPERVKIKKALNSKILTLMKYRSQQQRFCA